MLGRTDRRLRLIFLLVVFATVGVAAVARLSYWQLARGPELRNEALALLERHTEDLPPRGDILDRNGAILATSAYRYLLSASPSVIQSARAVPATVEGVASILGLDDVQVAGLTTALTGTDPYVVLQRRLTDAQSAAIRAVIARPASEGGLVGLALEPHAERVYPNPGGAPGTTLASHLLGFVTEAGEGQYGVEQFHDEVLAGQPTRMAALHDLNGHALTSSARILQEGRDGLDIALTIDAGLQLALEKQLYAAWVADQAQGASAVILHPSTGEILAWASVPGYDANDYARIAASSPESFIDPIATATFEPGSVMKMLTAAAAFDAGTVTPDQLVADASSLRFGGYSVRNYDGTSMGRIAFQDAIAFSRNVATARVAASLDRSVPRSSIRLHDMWTRLGIGQRSGVDVAGEALGLVADPGETTWQPLDLANRAFGQGVAVTQIQLAVAFGAMANGGLRLQPRVLASVHGEASQVSVPRPVLELAQATQLHDLLVHVTSRVPWYREATRMAGYEVGGKTGTAQIWDAAIGDWKHNIYNFSFVGFVGAAQPEAIVALRIHEAHPRIRAGGDLELDVASYELFRRIAEITISSLEVAPITASPSPGATRDPALVRGDRWELGELVGDGARDGRGR